MTSSGTFTCELELGNAEMQNADDIIGCLNEVIDLLKSGWTEKNILDINGNTVGQFSLQVTT